MRNFTKSLLALALMFVCVGGAKATMLDIDTRYTSISSLSDKIFAIVNETDAKALYGTGGNYGLELGYADYSTALANTNSVLYFKLISLTGDLAGYYTLRAIKPDGSDYTIGWLENGAQLYLNSGWSVSFIGGLNSQYGQDFENGAVWQVEYVENKGFILKNKAENGYLVSNGKANNEEPAYFTFCSLKEKTFVIPEPTRTATDALVINFDNFGAKSEGASWDPETKTFTGVCGFTWSGDGMDLSQYRYLVFTSAQNRDGADAGKVSIKDNNGMVIEGDGYGEAYQNMWMSSYNHLFCCKIDLEKLRSEQSFDIYHITELSIDGGTGFMMGTVYASNTAPNTQNRWAQGNEGSFRIENVPADKFGTICLPYQAAVACAKVYEIVGKTGSGILISEVNGLMVAGKPYFYQKIANKVDSWIYYDNSTIYPGNTIYFYQATDATVADPVVNNGLIGTFVETKAPVNSYILSSNKLYKVDAANTVTVGANKAYLDLTQVGTSSARESDISIEFNEPTGIKQVSVDTLVNAEIYNLAGQCVTQPTKGMYIVNGKKVIIK